MGNFSNKIRQKAWIEYVGASQPECIITIVWIGPMGQSDDIN